VHYFCLYININFQTTAKKNPLHLNFFIACAFLGITDYLILF